MSPRKRPPRPLIAVIALLLVALVAAIWWLTTRETDAAPVASGTVEAHDYQVAPVIGGTVTKVLVSEGDRVRRGQALVRLDARPLTLAVTQAEQGVNAARAAVTSAEDDGTDADVTAARARLAQARAAVDLAKVQAGYATVSAPHDGVVVTIATNAGQGAAPGRTMLTLIDDTDLFARVYLPEPQLGSVKVGGQANVAADTGTSYPGKVTFIDTKAQFTPNDVQTKDQRTTLVYEVRLSLADTGGKLKPGMPVDVTFR